MTTIALLSEHPNQRLERMKRAEKRIAQELRNVALTAALLHVLEHHPEAQTPRERLDLALELAKRSLHAGAKSLVDDAPVVAQNVKKEN